MQLSQHKGHFQTVLDERVARFPLLPGVRPVGPDATLQEKMLATMEYADASVGRFLESVRREPWFSNTVFIMLADHGAQLLHEAMPFMVEVGVLLDLIVGIFVMGIVMNHIQRDFESLDTDRLSELRD